MHMMIGTHKKCWQVVLGEAALVVLSSFLLVRLFPRITYSPFAAFHDAIENLLYAFYVANGRVPYRDFGSNHFPGVYLWVAIFAKISGVSGLNPSEQALQKMHLVGSLATSLIQVFTVRLGLRLMQVGAWFATLIAFMFFAYAYSFWDTYLPLSETYHLTFFFLLPILLYRMFFDEQRQSQLAFSLAIIFLFTPLTILFGLTSWPLNIWSSMVAAVFFWKCRYEIRAFIRLRYKTIIGAGLFISVVFVITISIVDVAKMWFNNFDFNRQFFNPFQLFEAIEFHFLRRSFSSWLFYNLVGTIALAVGFLIIFSENRYATGIFHRRFPFDLRKCLFVFIVIIGAWLTVWRENSAMKNLPLLGFNFGLLAILARGLSAELRPAVSYAVRNVIKSVINNVKFQLILKWSRIMVSIVLAANVIEMCNQVITHVPATPDTRHAVMEWGKVCRFREVQNCRCISITHFAPGLFLKNDVRQCSGWSIWVSVLARVPVILESVKQRIMSGKAALIIYSKKSVGAVGIPQSLQDFINQTYVCRDLTGMMDYKQQPKLCVIKDASQD